MNFTKGDFIKWTSSDAEMVGRFQRVVQDRVRIEISANGSTIEIPLNDGKITSASQPKDWNKATSVTKTKEPKVVTVPTIKKERSKNGGTKVDLVVELLKLNPPTSRQDAINKIVAAGISTPAGASTFYNMAKKVM